jgi:hypothetical protein
LHAGHVASGGGRRKNLGTGSSYRKSW